MAETTLQQVISSLYVTDKLLNAKFSNAVSGILTGLFGSVDNLKFPLTASIFDANKVIKLDYLPSSELLSGKLDKFDETTQSGLLTMTGPNGSIVASEIQLTGDENWGDLTSKLQSNIDLICGQPEGPDLF